MKKNPSNVRPSDNPTAHPSCTPGETPTYSLEIETLNSIFEAERTFKSSSFHISPNKSNLGGKNCRRKKEKHHLAWALKPCYFSSQRLRLQVELTVPYPLFLWFVRTCHDFPLQPCHFRPVTFYLLGASQSSSVSRLSGSFHEQRPSPFTAQILYQHGIDLLFCSVTVWYTP